MKKRILVGHEDPETGEMQWIPENDTGSEETYKATIGRVSDQLATVVKS